MRIVEWKNLASIVYAVTMSLDDIEFVNTEHNNYVKNKNKNKSIEILDVDDDIYDSCSEKEKEVK